MSVCVHVNLYACHSHHFICISPDITFSRLCNKNFTWLSFHWFHNFSLSLSSLSSQTAPRVPSESHLTFCPLTSCLCSSSSHTSHLINQSIRLAISALRIAPLSPSLSSLPRVHFQVWFLLHSSSSLSLLPCMPLGWVTASVEEVSLSFAIKCSLYALFDTLFLVSTWMRVFFFFFLFLCSL